MYKAQIKSFTTLLLFFTLTVIIAGCSSESGSSEKPDSNNTTTKETANSDEGTPQKGGEAVVAYGADLGNYDPIMGSSGVDQSLLWPVYDTLISFTPDLEPQPGLAESWEFPDENTIILHLRDGVTFHDGTRFDAEVVKFNIERTNSDDSLVSDLKNIASVEVVDSLTVKLHLKQPESSLLLALSDRGGMMVSPTAIKESGEDYSRNPVGAGPFKMVKWVPNGEIVLDAFEDYWQDGKPYLDKLIVKIMPDELTRINALKSGEVDLADSITSGNIANLEADATIILKQKMSLQPALMFINTSMPPLDNKAVRLAIQHGIDREALVQALTFGHGEPAYQLFPKEYWAADPDMKIEYDPEKSKQLLQEAGLENVSFTITHVSVADEKKKAEAIKGQLKQIGIEVDLEAVEAQTANVDYFIDQKVPAYAIRWTGRPDPHMSIKYLYSGDSFYNPGGGTTEEIESLISKASSTTNDDERAKLYVEINKLALLEEGITIPLYFTPWVTAVNKQVKGFEPYLSGKIILSDFWIER